MKINHGKTANQEVMYQFQDQRSRGTNGFGLMRINDDGTFALDRSTSEISACIDLKLNQSNMILFHHRAPTSSTNRIIQTHPILIESGSFTHDYYLVHNGVIHNDDELFEVHTKDLGIAYTTYETVGQTTQFNDSESLGIELARLIEGESKKVEAVGAAAFVIVQVDKKTQKVTKIFFGRNDGCPLNSYQREGELMLSSEGKGNPVTPDYLYSFDPFDPKLKVHKKKMEIERWKETKTTVVEGFKSEAKKDDKKDDWSHYQSSKDVRSYNDDMPPADDDKDDIMASLEDECLSVVSDFFTDLDVNVANPFLTDPRDYLKSLSQVFDAAIKQAELKYLDVDKGILDKTMEEIEADKKYANS